MGFPYKEKEEAKNFILGLFERLKQNISIRKSWESINQLFLIHLTDPELYLFLDTCGRKIDLSFSESEKSPLGEAVAGFSLNCNDFHDMYSGKADLLRLAQTGKIKQFGRTGVTVKLASTLPLQIKLYKEYLQEKGIK